MEYSSLSLSSRHHWNLSMSGNLVELSVYLPKRLKNLSSKYYVRQTHVVCKPITLRNKVRAIYGTVTLNSVLT